MDGNGSGSSPLQPNAKDFVVHDVIVLRVDGQGRDRDIRLLAIIPAGSDPPLGASEVRLPGRRDTVFSWRRPERRSSPSDLELRR